MVPTPRATQLRPTSRSDRPSRRVAKRICTTVAAWLHSCQLPTQHAIVISSLWPRTKARPSRIAGQNGELTALGVSFTGTPRGIDADTSSSSASASSASGAPVSLISAPAAPGPETSAVDCASAFLACASTRRARGTIWVSTTCAALPALVFTAPITNPTTYSQVIDKAPSHQAIGTDATVQATLISPTTYTGNLRTRSSHTPVGNEKKMNGAVSIAVRKPICVGEARSSTAAVSGNASSVTCPPNEEMKIEVHSRR